MAIQSFIKPSFLLQTKAAQRLYQEYAASLPIIDYHCHLNPRDIAENRRFNNLTELWIDCDPYKWRAMRMNGIEERLITGDSSAFERFTAWAHTLPRLAGNPLFHWSAMELQSHFGINEILGPDNAARIWDRCNEQLQDPGFWVQGLLKKARVEIVCTSDELLDDLSPHAAHMPETSGPGLLPSLRGDTILDFQSPGFGTWLERLAKLTSQGVTSLQDYKTAIQKRLDQFTQTGCLLADHSLERYSFDLVDEEKAESLFQAVLSNKPLQASELMSLRSHVLAFLGREYAERDWAMQLHLGAQRQTSTRLRNLLGPAGGFTCIGNSCDIEALCAFLDCLENRESLPRIILYNLNPVDNEMLASLSGSFVQEGIASKIQLGPAWWYNDHKAGLERHLTALGNLSLLPAFIGMTTDSRSFLSYVRHDYFRRVLCNLVGRWAEDGELPRDWEWLGSLIRGICYENACQWLGIK